MRRFAIKAGELNNAIQRGYEAEPKQTYYAIRVFGRRLVTPLPSMPVQPIATEQGNLPGTIGGIVRR